MNKVFVIGDTHFLHKRMSEYTGRPENFNRLIVENWNRVVDNDDLVIHLGDFSAGVKGRHELLSLIGNTLNGEKILIKGNHDHFEVSDYKNKYGFKDVYNYLVIEDILFTHYPIETNKYSKQNEINNVHKLKNIIKENDINFIVHGHTHNRDVHISGHYNCSVEKINYTPIELEILLNGETNGRWKKGL